MVNYVLPFMMIDVQEYIAADASCPYEKWFNSLNAQAAAKVAIAITRISQGNLSNVKVLRGSLHEYRIDFGPGYRIYLGRDGQRIIILLGGGTKKRQRQDIRSALRFWQEYKKRKGEQT